MSKKRRRNAPATSQQEADTAAAGPDDIAPPTGGLVRTHLKIGWFGLLIFLCLGIALEALHGFKSAWYLDVGNETRRLMFTLAHAHGVLLSLVNVAFAFTLTAIPSLAGGRGRLISRLLFAAIILLPSGFFLGGFFIQGGDPGLGILVVPVGALALLGGVAMTALAIGKR
jgi:hypothetical protein